MKIIVEAESAEELHTLFKELFEKVDVVLDAESSARVVEKVAAAVAPEVEKPAPKPKRKRRTKADIEADKAAETARPAPPHPTQMEPAPAKDDMTPELAKDLFAKCAAGSPDLTSATIKLLTSMEVSRPSELSPEGLLTFGREARKLLEKYA